MFSIYIVIFYKKDIMTVKELKEDIKKQLGVERSRQADIAHENAIIKKLSDSTSVDLPEELKSQLHYICQMVN